MRDVKKFMEYRGKALYHLLLAREDPEREIEDYRVLGDKALLSRLEAYQIYIDKETFLELSKDCESPEELVNILLPKGKTVEKCIAYLLLFEAWRRFCPDKQTLSIFCDELDLTISLYNEGQLGSDEYLQKQLKDLENILDVTVDQGHKPREVFLMVTCYFTQGIERFLYRYISQQIEEGFTTYASELIDAFSSYVVEPRFLQLLKVRLSGGSMMLAHLLDTLEEPPNFPLYIEVMRYLIHRREKNTFYKTLVRSLPHLSTENQLNSLTHVVKDYFKLLSPDELEKVVESLPPGFQELV